MAFDPSKYDDDVLADFGKDLAVGKHTITLLEDMQEKPDAFGDGRSSYKAKCSIEGLSQTVYFETSEPQDGAAIKEETNPSRKGAMQATLKMWKDMHAKGKTPPALKEGDRLKVRISRKKPKPDQDRGFLTVSEFYGFAGEETLTQTSTSGGPGF